MTARTTESHARPVHAALFAHRLSRWLTGIVVAFLIAIFVLSFFLDGIVRRRVEVTMNRSLKGYQVKLNHAHFQLLNLTLTLNQLSVMQAAHPRPAVAEFPIMRFQIQWKELLARKVVGSVSLGSARIHIDRAQLASEQKDKTPLRQKGWQEALENVYPFKINRFAIHDGDIIYIDSADSKPLHLAHLNFVSDNIRNIHSPDNVYPSRLNGEMVIFDRGHMSLDGRANYLMEPFPGMKVHYRVHEVPLEALTPAVRHVNVAIEGGSLYSAGLIEYSPKLTNVDVDTVTISSLHATYIHQATTKAAETTRIKAAGNTVQKQNNRPAVNIKVREFATNNCRLDFEDHVSDPPFKLYLSDAFLQLENLSNHEQQGPAVLKLKGKFMGSGTSDINGKFSASRGGPEFTMNVAIRDTDMPSLNPLLRAYGRFDVQQGLFSLYSELSLKNGNMGGYAKPMFSNLKVYGHQKDQSRGVLHQAKELAIGAAAHLFKSTKTQQVATKIDISGRLDKPNVSTWQAIVAVVQNAFLEAILPGFDREANPTQ